RARPDARVGAGAIDARMALRRLRARLAHDHRVPAQRLGARAIERDPRDGLHLSPAAPRRAPRVVPARSHDLVACGSRGGAHPLRAGRRRQEATREPGGSFLPRKTTTPPPRVVPPWRRALAASETSARATEA